MRVVRSHDRSKVVTGDGNLLLNVGPKANGGMVAEWVEQLQQMGKWLEQYSKSIYGTRGGPISNATWGGTTHRGNCLYVHILD